MVGTTAPQSTLPSGTRPGEAEPAALAQLPSLLNRFEAATQLARDALSAGDWPDAFLLLAGLNQAAEDYLQRDLAGSREVVAMLHRRSPRLARAYIRARQMAMRLRALGMGDRRVAAWQAEAEAVVGIASVPVLDRASTPDSGDRMERTLRLLQRASQLPRRLRAEALRLPACFRSADQQPADCVAMAEAFAIRWSDRRRPILVLGIRTSGSYLAPLVGGALRGLGYVDVRELSCRPDRGLGRRQAHAIKAATARSGMVLVVDDSPVSGRTYRAVARQVGALGVPDSAIVLMVALLYGEGDQLPEGLRGYQSVVLPWASWAIHRELEPDAVRASLDRLLSGRSIEVYEADGTRTPIMVDTISSVRLLPLAPVPDMKGGARTRRHVRGRYLAHLTEQDSHETRKLEVYLKGVGYGYFGTHSLAVSEPLAEFHPPVYGIVGGCLFRAYLPDTQGFDTQAVTTERLAERVAAYAVARRDRLRLPADPTEDLGEWAPAWRRAADWLQPPFGKLRLPARPLLSAASRRLLRPSVPAVIDDSMALNRWYGPVPAPVKVDYDERGLETHSSDPAFQIAVAAADSLLVLDWQSGFPEEVRHRYQLMAGESVDPERWFLMRTVHLTAYLAKLGWAWIVSDLDEGERRALVVEVERVRRALSRVHQDYLASVYFADVVPPQHGSVCAIDIDGVLETGTMGWPTGYPVATPLAALALRALARHGRRAVLVSGRTLPEIRDRCSAFRLAGGVAEFGCVTYTSGKHGETVTTDAEGDDVVDRLRDWLRRQDHPVHVDATYEHVARAYIVDTDGVRRRLDDELVNRMMQDSRGAISAVVGTSQVDFVPRTVNKASGLERLLDQMDGNTDLEMAIGDTENDLPMLRMARKAYAPANGASGLQRAGIRTLSGTAQRGLAQAVTEIIGHRPGGCGVCRPPRPSPRQRLLLTPLKASDSGRFGHVAQVVALTTMLARR
jgi:hydroxymethylpyrimidine pyrophosphatase-like HAD family hydrolase/adenine/guanine phosphoribosyltransferase-like PRPP-binding protein